MGEVFDFGQRYDAKHLDIATDKPSSAVPIHPMLKEALFIADPDDTKNESNEIARDYQLAILSGVPARDALARAITRTRRLR